MPRKSTTAPISPTSPTTIAPAPTMDGGDTSIMSAATDASTGTKPAKTPTSAKPDKDDRDSLGIDDLLLPRTLVSRLARGTLPANTSIQKDALLALTKAASVFISALASTANEMTTKKTIAPGDVLKACEELELGEVMQLGVVVDGGEAGGGGIVGGRLERELAVWEGVVRGKRKGYREKVRAKGGKGGEKGEKGEGVDESTVMEEEDGERDAKRVRMGTDGDRDGEGGAGMAPPASRSFVAGEGQRSAANGASRPLSADGQIDDGDETQLDDEGDQDDDDANGDEGQDEEDDEDEPSRGDEETDGYGPDDQLRHDMNGNDTGDDSD